jgi:carboxymethylenebutenolidase
VERMRAADFPQELLNLFDHYVHGEISRRQFLDGATKYAVGGLTAMAIWDSLRPNYALAEKVPKDDKRLKTEYATVSSPQGNGSVRGYFVRPASANGRLPGVLVIHENRGLNPYIEDVARRLGTANFLAFAPDGLTSVGGYPGDDEKGAEFFGKVDENKMFEDFVASATWLKSRPECTGKSASWVSVLAEPWPISWRCGSLIWRLRFHSTAGNRLLQMLPRSRRLFCFTMHPWTRVSPRDGRLTKQR